MFRFTQPFYFDERDSIRKMKGHSDVYRVSIVDILLSHNFRVMSKRCGEDISARIVESYPRVSL